MRCTHVTCGRDHRIWLPLEDTPSSDVSLHPWCVNCGIMQNISDDRPKKLGFWMNVLSRITHNMFLSKSQIRLIAKSLESHELFQDLFGVTGSAQKQIFLLIVQKYSHVDLHSINSCIY